jgi:hypothetical protein
MKTIIAFILLLTYPMTACVAMDTERKLESLWHSLISSANERDEAKAVESLSAFTKKQKIIFMVTIVDASDNKTNLSEYDNKKAISKIYIRFQNDDLNYQGDVWKPKSISNFYMLLRE